MVNGRQREVKASPDTPLLYVLRNQLGVMGVKFGCGLAQCGACTVLLGDEEVRSCMTPISALEGKPVLDPSIAPKVAGKTVRVGDVTAPTSQRMI